MKLSRSGIRLGTKARHAVPFPTRDAPLPLPVTVDGVVTYPEAEGVILVDVRPLSSDERRDALARAHEWVKSKGAEPREGSTLYDLSVMAEICALACIDHESPADAPEPFFDGVDEKGQQIGAVAQALSLDTDRLTLLFQAFCDWEATCNPRRVGMSVVEYAMTVSGLAQTEDGDDRFFDSLGPVMLRICARTMARQLAISHAPSLAPSSPSPVTTTG